MIVRCEQCKTRYRLDPRRIKTDTAKVRCSRCGHVFEISADEDRLPFIPKASEDDRGDTPSSRRIPRIRLPKPSISSIQAKKWILGGSAAIVVLLAVGMLWKTWIPSFKTGSALQSPFPADDPGNKRLALEAVEGSFLETQHSDRLFVIHGTVRNQYPFPVRYIRLQAFLHGEVPDSSLDVRLFAGNPLSEKELASRTLPEIQDAMRTKAGRDGLNERIPPGSTVPFSVVFAELPANPVEYAVKIEGCEAVES